MARKEKGSFLGQNLLAAADEAIEWHQGKRELRVTDVNISPPPEFTHSKIKAIRKQFNVSQPVFANIVGCSPSAVKAWEQGLKKPNMAARRLLQLISGNSDIVADILKGGSKVG